MDEDRREKIGRPPKRQDDKARMVSFRLQPAILDALKNEAETQGVSQAAILARAVEAYTRKPKSMKCIFCLKAMADDERSKEHVIPEALGSRRVVIWDVCHPCNNTLGGNVDSVLINSQFVQLARMSLGIKGKAKEPPNAFKKGAVDAETGAPMKTGFDEQGRLTARAETRHSHTIKEDGSFNSQVSLNSDDASDPAFVKKHLQALAKGHPELKGKPIPEITDDHVKQLMETGSVDVAPGFTLTADRRQSKEVKQTMVLDLHDFKPAVVKIIYELAYRWLGPDYLDDPRAGLLRGIVNTAATGPVDVDDVLTDGRVDMGLKFPADAFWGDEPQHHRAIMMRQGDAMLLYLSIFGMFRGVIVVTQNARAYPDAQDMFLSVDPGTGETRERPLPEELATKAVFT